MGRQEEKERWPGFPERLREAFQRAGYWKNDRPDIMRFGLEHAIHVSYLYKYVGGDAVPDRERLIALGTALGVHPAWLLFGNPLPVDGPSGLKGKSTPPRVSKGKDKRYYDKFARKPLARVVHYRARTAVSGARRRVA